MKFSRFKLEPESVSSARVHVSSEKYVNSISANQFGIFGASGDVDSTGQAVLSHFVPGLVGFFFYSLSPHLFPR